MKLMRKPGFTLIELIVVIAILALLAVALLAVLNPLEMINRSKDTATLSAAQTVNNAIVRFNSVSRDPIVTKELTASDITTPDSQTMLAKLVTNNELKTSFITYASRKITPLLFTITPDLAKLNICFVPLSNSFKTRPDTIYNGSGSKIDCTNQVCHLCINSVQSDSPASSPQPIVIVPSPTPIAASCDNFNPEAPDYAFTCNTSSKWQQYNCSNFCVADKGCDSYCPPGSRHLIKTYNGIGMTNFISCITHSGETTESYCVSGPAAHCDKMSYPSSTSDYIWGCTNPRRPYDWQ